MSTCLGMNDDELLRQWEREYPAKQAPVPRDEIEPWRGTSGHSERLSTGTWHIRAYWAEVDGRPECVGLGLWKGCEPVEGRRKGYRVLPGQMLSRILATDLRAIPIGDILRRLRKTAMQDDHFLRALGQRDPSLAALASHDRGFGKKKGRIYGEEYWARVAGVYTEAFQRGHNPTRAVQRTLKITSYNTAKRHVSRARDAGYLPRLGQQRAGIVAARRARKAPSNRRTR